ncbi:unnamed protein product, partial [Ascophyllum nodosum]
MAHSILKNKRDRFLKAQQGKAGGSSSSGTRRNADTEVADPVITALRGGGRTRSGVASNKPDEQETEVDWRTQKAETLLSSMDSMGASNALELLEAKGSKAAKDIRHHIQELGAKASVAISLERAIEQAKKQNGTKEGNRAWQALLTAAAFGSGEEGGSTMSTKRK